MKRGRKTLAEKYGLTENEVEIIKYYCKGNCIPSRVCEIIAQARNKFINNGSRKLKVLEVIYGKYKMLTILENGELKICNSKFRSPKYFYPEYNLFSKEDLGDIAHWAGYAHKIGYEYVFSDEFLVNLLIFSLQKNVLDEVNKIPIYTFLGLPGWMKNPLRNLFKGINYVGVLLPSFSRENLFFVVLKTYIKEYINDLIYIENPVNHPCFDFSFEEIAKNYFIEKQKND